MSDRLTPEQHDDLEGIPSPAETPVVIGHDDVRADLATAYAQGRLHHALLLAGPEGVGKATLAFHLANHLLTYPQPADAPSFLSRPDPASSIFRVVAQGAHPAILHLTRPVNERTKGFRSAVTVEEIRRINKFLSLSSHDGSWRIVIVDPADDMNVNAANALLKNLEEPPKRTLFILTAHRPGRLLPTIRSRCRLVRMNGLRDGELEQVVAGFGLALPDDPEARAATLRLAQGSVRAALVETLYGGAEIAGAIHEAVHVRQFDPALAMRIADAVTQRDQPQQFGLFNSHLQRQLSEGAEAAARQGQTEVAARLAELWGEVRRMQMETDTYNLDRRHHVFSVLRTAHEGLAA